MMSRKYITLVEVLALTYFPLAHFQAILKEKRDISGVVVSNFNANFSNNFYHSIYDNYTK